MQESSEAAQVRVARKQQQAFNETLLPQAQRQAVAAAKARKGCSGRVGNGGQMLRQVPLAAVMNALRTEGRGVLRAEGEGYWRDMERRHPEIAVGTDALVVPGHRNRHGRVTETCVGGVWRKA